MIYHLQVIKKGVSVLLDSDINYFHHFDIDDIISIEYTINSLSIIKLNSDSMVIKSPHFVINWDSTKSKKLSISELIWGLNSVENYISDITEMILREEKLNLLGI